MMSLCKTWKLSWGFLIQVFLFQQLSLAYFRGNQINGISTQYIRGNIHVLKVITDLLSVEAFEAATSQNKESQFVVIDFQKSQCKPCLKVAPIIDEMSKRYEGRVQFFKVDADSSKEALGLMKRWGVRSVPTFHFWIKGQQVNVLQGANTDAVEEYIIAELKKLEAVPI